jgi:hypothetical protein
LNAAKSEIVRHAIAGKRLKDNHVCHWLLTKVEKSFNDSNTSRLLTKIVLLETTQLPIGWLNAAALLNILFCQK